MAATSNIALKVSFKEKDEAKALGARWNPDGKHWYVPEGIDAALFEKWLGGAVTQTTVSKKAIPTTVNEKPSKLPASKDMDDINAMLRDAYEVSD